MPVARLVRGVPFPAREGVRGGGRSLAPRPPPVIATSCPTDPSAPSSCGPLDVAAAILAESTLSFLGWVSPDIPTGAHPFRRQGNLDSPHWAILPGTAISHHAQQQLLGDGLRDALDPGKSLALTDEESSVPDPISASRRHPASAPLPRGNLPLECAGRPRGVVP